MNTTIRHATSTPMMPRERHRTDAAVVHRVGMTNRRISGSGHLRRYSASTKLVA